MATLGNTPRPAYVYDTETDTWVPVGVGAHTHSDIPNTLIDAKGDLITATADNVPARLAKGADGTILVSDSTTQTGLAWQPYAAQSVAGKNIIINGGFDFFQRSTFSTTSSGYGLDRWFTIASGSSSATVLTQQTTGVPNGSRYCMRIAMGASGGYGNQFHLVETSNVAQLWGQTVTFSVKLRRNASFAGSLSFAIEKSATIDASMGATWVSIASSSITNANLPTGTGSSNWFTASVTLNIPNDNTANSLRIQFGQSQVEASGAYWEIAQCQLEQGPIATPFSRAGGTIQGELAACQRYYWRFGGNAVYQAFGNGIATIATSAQVVVTNPVSMRAVPTSHAVSNVGLTDSLTTVAVTSSVIGQAGINQNLFQFGTASGLTQFRPYILNANNTTNAFIEVSAEL